jgi:hypothetical protein
MMDVRYREFGVISVAINESSCGSIPAGQKCGLDAATFLGFLKGGLEASVYTLRCTEAAPAAALPRGTLAHIARF